MVLVIKGSAPQTMMMTQLVSLNGVCMLTTFSGALDPIHSSKCAALLLTADSPRPSGERKVKGPYFEFAKKKWETEDTFRFAHLL